MFVEAWLDSSYQKVINSADIITPDGKPLTWALRLLYGIRQDRVAGSDILPELLRECEKQQLTVVFYGGSQHLLTGLRHPWSGLDQVLAMIAVGIWGAQLGNPALWVLPVTFPLVMSQGAMMGLLGFPLPGVEIGIALSALLLGAMVGREARPKLAVAGVLVGLFAIFHGHAHGAELPAGQSGMLYSMGS